MLPERVVAGRNGSTNDTVALLHAGHCACQGVIALEQGVAETYRWFRQQQA